MSKTVFVNGCFDVIHRGHIALFRFAKNLGDRLIVAIDEDDRIRESKGPNRPINILEDRLYVLRPIKYIDELDHFGSDKELENLVKKYKPDIMMVGSDWIGKRVIGSQYAKNVRFFNRIGHYSTTNIIEGSSHR